MLLFHLILFHLVIVKIYGPMGARQVEKKSKKPRNPRKWMAGLRHNSDYFFFCVCVFCVVLFLCMFPKNKLVGGGCMSSGRSNFFSDFCLEAINSTYMHF